MRDSPKKKILITAMSMNIGGAEKSLVNLLSLLDYSVLDVDLLLFQRRGEFLPQIPDAVNVISVPEIDVLYGAKPDEPLSAVKKASLTVMRYLATGFTRLTEKQFDRCRLNRWQGFYSRLIPALPNCYDCAVSYSGGETFWYLVEKVEADRKVIYFHSDYSNINIDAERECEYIKHAHAIVAVSEKCAESLKRIFPSQAEKVRVVQNPSSVSLIEKMASKAVSDSFSPQDDTLKVVSVGRLHPAKGFDMAVQAAAILALTHAGRFEWIVVGDGEQKPLIERRINEEELAASFRLIGAKPNPYPYFAAADVLVQPSRFEGKSVVLDEAKVFSTPAIVTNYSSAADQISDGVDGLIVDMEPEALADGIKRCMDEPGLVERLKQGASTDIRGELEDISAFMDLLVG